MVKHFLHAGTRKSSRARMALYFSSKCAPCFFRRLSILLESFVSEVVRAAAQWMDRFLKLRDTEMEMV